MHKVKLTVVFLAALMNIHFMAAMSGCKKTITEEEIPELFVRSSQVFTPASTLQIGLGDFDDDGDLDAVFSNMGEVNSTVWTNNGSGHFTNTGQNLTTWGHGLGVGDLDGDGDLDLFMTCASYVHPSRIYFNDGSGRFSDSGQSLVVTSFGKAGLGDFDGNGGIDAFISNFGFPNQVWMNNGTGQFTDSGLRLNGALNDNTTHVSVGDLDNDGDLDVFVANFVDGRNEIWFNNNK